MIGLGVTESWAGSLSDELKGWPDERLQEGLQAAIRSENSPVPIEGPLAPGYLILAEMTSRKDTRSRGAAGGERPQMTIAEEALGLMPQGMPPGPQQGPSPGPQQGPSPEDPMQFLASLGAMQGAPGPPMAMASGGLVRGYQDGGSAVSRDVWRLMELLKNPDLSPQERVQIEKALKDQIDIEAQYGVAQQGTPVPQQVGLPQTGDPNAFPNNKPMSPWNQPRSRADWRPDSGTPPVVNDRLAGLRSNLMPPAANGLNYNIPPPPTSQPTDDAGANLMSMWGIGGGVDTAIAKGFSGLPWDQTQNVGTLPGGYAPGGMSLASNPSDWPQGGGAQIAQGASGALVPRQAPRQAPPQVPPQVPQQAPPQAQPFNLDALQNDMINLPSTPFLDFPQQAPLPQQVPQGDPELQAQMAAVREKMAAHSGPDYKSDAILALGAGMLGGRGIFSEDIGRGGMAMLPVLQQGRAQDSRAKGQALRDQLGALESLGSSGRADRQLAMQAAQMDQRERFNRDRLGLDRETLGMRFSEAVYDARREGDSDRRKSREAIMEEIEFLRMEGGSSGLSPEAVAAKEAQLWRQLQALQGGGLSASGNSPKRLGSL